MMSSPRGSHHRQGFTLIEVALASIVGILVIYGAIVSFQMRKESAGNSVARERVNNALGTVASFMATNGNYPVSGSNQFAAAWASLHPDEKSQSPWGGSTGDPTLGVSEDPPLAMGSLNPSTAPDATASVTVNSARQANLYYVSLQNTANYVGVASSQNPTPLPQRGFVLSIYDSNGNPWLWVVGGK
jgi:type II secretory pathway pseudopilin PulG